MTTETISDFDGAFIAAYRKHVADADEKTVSEFIACVNADLDGDEIHSKFGCQYGGLMDALCVFNEAVKFARKEQAHAFIAALTQLQSITENDLVLAPEGAYSIEQKLNELKALV